MPEMAQGKKHTAIVGIMDLQVLLTPDGDLWVAQAIECDYAAMGSNLEDVKRNFEQGLFETIHEHLKQFGHLKKLLKPADPELWWDFVTEDTQVERYSQISQHEYEPRIEERPIDYFAGPFGKIRYIVPPLTEAQRLPA